MLHSTICNINVITHVMLDIQYFHYQHWLLECKGHWTVTHSCQGECQGKLLNSRNSRNQNFARINKTRQHHNITCNITNITSPAPNNRENYCYENNTCMLPYHMPLLVCLLNKPVFTFITYKVVSRQLSLCPWHYNCVGLSLEKLCVAVPVLAVLC